MLGQIGGAIKGMLVGGVMFLVAFPLHFWNEWRSVTTANAIQHVRENVVSISADKVDPKNDGKVVHLTGNAVTDEVLRDDEFGVSTTAIRIDRKVEMYQWVEYEETRDNDEDEETYYEYKKEWSSDYHSSNDFEEPAGHQNPPRAYHPKSEQAKKVTVGAFGLNQGLISSIRKEEELKVAFEDLPADMAAKLIPNPEGGFYYPVAAKNLTAPTSDTDRPPSVPAPTDPAPPNDSKDDGAGADDAATEDGAATDDAAADETGPGDDDAATDDGVAAPPDGTARSVEPTDGADDTGDLSTSSDDDGSAAALPKSIPEVAKLGDLKITFTYTAHDQPVSMIAGQQGSDIVSYQVPGYPREQNRLEMGKLTAEKILANQESENNLITWGIRIGGTFLMFIGLMLVLRPLTMVTGFIPIIGGIVNAGATLAAGVLSLALSFITISISWVFVRPMIGIPLLVVGIALIAGLFYLGSKKKQPEDEAAVAAEGG